LQFNVGTKLKTNHFYALPFLQQIAIEVLTNKIKGKNKEK